MNPRWRSRRGVGLGLGIALAATVSASCSRHRIFDLAMRTAHRPPATRFTTPSGYRLLAGDLHCHVSPPDTEAIRDVRETGRLARREGLDFVVLTPHVGARFFEDERERAWAVRAQRQLRRALRSQRHRGTIFITGFEYTDHRQGHLGLSFADVDRVLAAVPAAVARRNPGRFFEEWVARGGLVFVHHPVNTPLSSIFRAARADLSWRPWSVGPGGSPPEIRTADRLALGFEAYNMMVSNLRDRYLLFDEGRSLRRVMARIDREILARRRRLIPTGGTDSHSFYLRPTLFVLAREKSKAGIRDALVSGRVCIRGPNACTLKARVPGGERVARVGEQLRSDGIVEVTARGDKIRILRNSIRVLSLRSGQTGRVRVPRSTCSLLRAEIDDGYSAPIYVNCPFAKARAR